MSESDEKWKPFLESVGMTFLDVSEFEPKPGPVILFVPTMTEEEKEEFRKKLSEAMVLGIDPLLLLNQIL